MVIQLLEPDGPGWINAIHSFWDSEQKSDGRHRWSAPHKTDEGQHRSSMAHGESQHRFVADTGRCPTPVKAGAESTPFA